MASKTRLSLSSLSLRRKKRTHSPQAPDITVPPGIDAEYQSTVTGLWRWRHRQPKISLASSDSTTLPSATTGDTEAKSDQDTVANDSITKAIVQSAQTQKSLDPKAPSGDFWDRAYQLLREDQSQKSSMNKYEKILALEYGGQYQSPTVSGILTSSDKEKMTGLVAKMLERIEDERWRIKIRDTSIELRPQVDRFVNAVIAVKDFVSSAVSSEPHATLAWAGVCIILPLLTNPTMQQKALVEGVDHISTVIVRFAVLDRLYHSRTPSPTQKDMIDLAKRFETQTIKLYSQILSYQAHVTCHLARAAPFQVSRDVIKVDDWAVKITEIKASEAASQETFRLLGLGTADKALEDQGQQMRHALKDHHQQMNELLQQLQTRSSNEKAEELAWKKTAEESKCLQALCENASTYEDTKNRNRQRVPNTCRWFLDSKIFHDWREDRSSALLWVTADPGCGKSVLSKSLVDDELRSTEASTTAYFFFRNDSPETKSVLRAISALLHQLGSQRRTLLSTIIAQYHSKGGQMLRSFSWLWNLLLETTRRPEAGEIVCVLDALDECDETERAVLIDALDRLRQEEQFDQSTLRLAGENESGKLKNEIDLVIKDKVANIAKRRKLSQKTRERLQERLIETKNRTYLWLHLVLPGLENSLIRNSSDVDHEIDNLSSLDDAYEAILSRSPRPEQARRLLHIIVAAVRPLTIYEMNIALNIKRGDKCLEAMDLDPEDALISNIKNICGLFVTVHKSRIYLLHQTAKEFLVCPSRPENSLHGASPSVIQGDDSFYRLPQRYLHDDALEDNIVLGQTTPKRSQLTTTVTSNVRIWKFSLDPVESHHVLAQTCLAYLLFDFMDEPVEMTDDDASSRSAASLDAAEIDRIFLSDDLDNGDCSDSFDAVQGSLSARGGQTYLDGNIELPSSGPAPHETLSDSDKPKDPANINPLSARSELSSMEQWPGSPSSAASPIPYDTAFGSDGQDCIPSPLSGRSPREGRTRDLLSERHDLLRYASQNWALHYEAARQDKDLQAMWLSFCIPDSPKLTTWSFLQGYHINKIPANIPRLALACCFGHNRMVAHCLSENDDIESRDSHGCTPLIWAVKRGNEATVDFLVASGALINSLEFCGRTPLWFAAELGQDKIAEKLISGGAFLNPESKSESPGSDQNFDMHPTWSSPLAAAVTELIAYSSYVSKVKEASYLNVIRLLLDWGAVVDSGTREASPLWLAIKSFTEFSHGQEAVVKLLLSKGADINFQDTECGATPLYRAVISRVLPIIGLIIKGKPKLDVQDSSGHTPLYLAVIIACGNDDDTIFQMLLKAGSDPNVTSHIGTSLHAAAENGKPEFVELLLTAGADANAKDLKGRTPLDLAQLELEDELNNREPQGIFFRPRDPEALMKIVELLRPITTEMVAGTDITLERASQSDSLPSTPAAHSKSGSSPSFKSSSPLSVEQ